MNMTRAAFGAFIGTVLLVPGCQCWNQITTDIRSQTSGLKRNVVLYDYNGHRLASWHSKTVIDADSGGLTTFFDSTGCRVLVNGGILISVESEK